MKQSISRTKALKRWLRKVGDAAALEALGAACDRAIVFVVDDQRSILLWNAAAERILGFSAEEALGAHCLKVNRCTACMRSCRIADRSAVSDEPITLLHRDGHPVMLRKTARAFFDDTGEFIGGIEVLVPEPSDARPSERGAPPQPDGTVQFHGLVSRDPAMLGAFQTIRNVAETDAYVLVRGESGTGKELVARAVHTESYRSAGPFVAVNCASLAPTLIESELFGHVRGAFTGAARDHAGLFEQANGGTLFLDEVAELPLELQAKLLRVLQERSFTPLGGSRQIEVDARVVAATHRSLREEVRRGRFREDLMYRLRVVPIFLPPLRDRRGDVELLLRSFIEQRNRLGPRRIEDIAPDAMRALLDHRWPGNVRELRNVVEYAFAVGRAPELQLMDLPPEFREAGATGIDRAAAAASAAPDEAERIRQALAAAGGHIGRAAELLGMSRPTFWRKRRLHGIGDD